MSRSDLERDYDDQFFEDLEDEVRSSASVIVPIVIECLQPTSVLDVGCGRGTWLRAFLDHGVSDIVGVDGPHVDVKQLEIPESAFIARDLREPLALDRRFDLVISLEVAEHLDAELASPFVATLVARAPAVLFSAAIPFQGGAGHVNEAWQSTWAAAFAVHGFRPVDLVRPRVWDDDRVAFWYAQNTLLYVDEASAHDIISTLEGASPTTLDLVHPRLHTRSHTTPAKPAAPLSLSRLLRDLPAASRRALQHRWRGHEGSGSR
jgi:SAM-dependent methyltransferase